ncbi:unnamed protein product [Haemonchus placei]|uniref:Uncharacterized protein n=1 Tax=Haemonchus placei TaxID=6290 RepID=A0A3P7SY57_HAEPC|nr:unnamed protein product [Haemonchus placei]
MLGAVQSPQIQTDPPLYGTENRTITLSSHCVDAAIQHGDTKRASTCTHRCHRGPLISPNVIAFNNVQTLMMITVKAAHCIKMVVKSSHTEQVSTSTTGSDV